jgi:hypothetical protein
MKVLLYTRWTLDDDGRFVIVEERSREYNGPVALAKKGREQMGENAAAGAAQSKTNNANSNAAFNSARGLLAQDESSTTPGSLSPAAAAQFAADRDNISRTYNGMRQTAFSTMGERGLASAPSGFSQVAQNAANRGEADAQTGAYRNAQVNTQNQRNFATTGEANLAGQQGNLGASNLGASTGAAVAQNHAGSTAGDIMGGIAEAAPIIAAPFTGGASLIPALAMKNAATNPFSNMGSKGNGVGSYGTGYGA